MTDVYGYSSSPPPPLDTFNSNLLFGGGGPSSPFLPGDEELDVDASFASSMSITSDRPAYQSPSVSPGSPFVPLPSTIHSAMDVSPAYSLKSSKHHFDAPSRPPPPPPFNASSSSSSIKTIRRPSPPPPRPSFSRVRSESAEQKKAVPSASGASRRTFGKEISVNMDSPSRSAAAGPTTVKALGGLMGPPALPSSNGSPSTMGAGKNSSGGKTRAPLPSQWKTVKTMGGGSELRRGGKLFAPAGPSRRDSDPVFPETGPVPSFNRPASQEYLPRSSLDMDVDDDEPPFLPSIPASPVQLAAFDGNYDDFFTGSPSTAPAHKTTFGRPQSSSPESSPSSKRSSFGSHRSSGGGGNLFERAFSAGPASGPLFGGPRAATLASRSRLGPYKRPALTHFQTSNNMDDANTSPSQSSAYPILTNTSLANGAAPPPPTDGTLFAGATFPRALPPMRRAYSVSTEQVHVELRVDSSPSASNSSQFEDSPSQLSVGVQQEYAQRHHSRVVRLADGTAAFRPAREGETAECAMKSPMKESSPSSMFGGFGSNEKDGKILPCHSAKEDGLMRIKCSTLDDLINGKYASEVSKFHIIDCRFGYEYAGGHIEGAVNVQTEEEVHSYLLTPGSGIYADGSSLPEPSTSAHGAQPGGKQIIVFHCEFSKKRGPEIAKKLRTNDRALNQPSYPSLYYPEVYILEGGYCEFFKQRPATCNPSRYIAMDDPLYQDKRSTDIQEFRSRKFGRAQSWQGEVPSNHSNSLFSNATVRPHSSGPPILAFAAATAAQGKRRAAGGMMVHEEEDHSDLSFSSADGSLGSPCAAPRSRNLLGPAGPVSRLKARVAMDRTKSVPLVSLMGRGR
ncbi:hypothetical protein BDY24DRAFT_171031 [Mrakia frigida]|uniref:putative tyrosine protein phosphatase MIH1 n=1 Tax=Mrakia frigida TaxID=29902 RepID=UPI003FCC0E65